VIEISAVMPACNEQDNIETAVKKLDGFFSRKFKNYEIIVVDDGSTDKTGEILGILSKKNKKLVVLKNKKNLGYGATVWKGLRTARGELVFFTDSDLQFDIRELGKFVRKAKSYDAIIGYRQKRSEGFLRAFNAWGWRVICWVMLGINYKDIDCAFKLIKRSFIEKIRIKSTGAAFSAELLYRLDYLGASICQMPVKHFKRKSGYPTGAKLSVIYKGFKEIFNLYQSQKKLIESRSNFIYAGTILLLFLSRYLFISYSADFFDASEYIRRTGYTNLLDAIGTEHPPFHPLYLFLSYIFYHYLKLASAAYALALVNVVFGTFSVIAIFLLVKRLFSERVAWLTSLFYSLIPIVFISQITILVDPVEHFFYFLSLYLFSFAITEKRGAYLYSFLGGFSLALAALAHTQVAFWVTGFLAVMIILRKEFRLRRPIFIKAVIFILSSLVAVMPYVFLLIRNSRAIGIGEGTVRWAFDYLFFGNVSDTSGIELLRSAKYFFLLPTSVIGILAILGIIAIAKKNILNLIALLLWLAPFVVTSGYIYENLHGRAMIIGVFVIVLLATLYICEVKKTSLRVAIILIVLASLVSIVVPAVSKYHYRKAPFELLSDLQRKASDGVFVSSNVSRTWHDYKGQFFSFGDVDVATGTILDSADLALSRGDKFYISSDAIQMPFKRYDGKYLDIRSTNIGSYSDHESLLSPILNKKYFNLDSLTKDYRLAVYSVQNDFSKEFFDKIDSLAQEKDIVFGRILNENEPVSSAIVNIKSNDFCRADKDDLSGGDPFFCLVRSLKNTFYIDDFTFTDKGGWFASPTKQEEIEIVIGSSPVGTKIPSINDGFVSPEPIYPTIKESKIISSMEDLKAEILKIKGSFYVKTDFFSGKKSYSLYVVETPFKKINEVAASRLSGQIGEKITDRSSENKKVKCSNEAGYLISGPNISFKQGKYKMIFKVKSPVVSDGSFEIDAFDSKRQKNYGKGEFKLSDYYKEYKDAQVTVDINEPVESLEFRLKVLSDNRVCVDSLQILPI